LEKQGSSAGVSNQELIDCAIRSLGLNELSQFDPSKKIIEYLLKNPKDTRLVDMSVTGFANETASDSPAPGGGSIAALAGALGASLGTMVANLSAGKRGWEDRVEEFSIWAEKGQQLKDRLLFLVDEDTRAFDAIMQAFGLPKDTPEQVAERKAAIQEASKYATLTPYYTMQAAYDCVELLQEMAEKGNPNSLSDVGVGALCIKTAVRGAWLNVITNASGLSDKAWAADIVEKARAIWQKNHPACDAIVEKIEAKLLG
jgi:glutamate formiminotransferase/formiminotetrahydrofolate cyclodeaminase